MEQGLVARESQLAFRAIPAAAVRGRGPLALLRSSLIILWGIWQSWRLIRAEQPAAILGTGGYVCVPLFVAARLRRVPTMIYLPDIVPGLAVRLLARIANRVACSFEPSLAYLPRNKTVVTGYPLREELDRTDRARSRQLFDLKTDLPVVLVYGGSRGARSINRAVEQLLGALLELSEVIHVCGREGDETFLRLAASQLPPRLAERYHLYPYLEKTMPDALAAADLAICRAGASTLGELPALGLPAILIPLMHVHQDKNAAYLADRGAAIMVPDDDLLGNGQPAQGPLMQAARRLLTRPEELREMGRRSQALAQPQAARRLANEIMAMAGSK